MKTNSEGLRIIEIYNELFEGSDIRAAEKAVDLLIIPQLNENQFAAAVSFCQSLGVDEFKRSSFLKVINKKPYTRQSLNAACEKFKEYAKTEDEHGKERVDKLLKSRRNEEIKLFKRPVLKLVKVTHGSPSPSA